jgi:hypothetical protein
MSPQFIALTVEESEKLRRERAAEHEREFQYTDQGTSVQATTPCGSISWFMLWDRDDLPLAR